jgi:hypothetical protein
MQQFFDKSMPERWTPEEAGGTPTVSKMGARTAWELWATVVARRV